MRLSGAGSARILSSCSRGVHAGLATFRFLLFREHHSLIVARLIGRFRLGCFLLLLVLVLLHLRFVDGAFRLVRRHGPAPLRHLLDQLRGREVLHQLPGVHAQRAQRLQPRLQRRVVNLFGMQLLLDPLVHAHGRYAIHVARPGAKGQPVERVQRPLTGIHLHLRRCFLFFFLVAGPDRSRNRTGEN